MTSYFLFFLLVDIDGIMESLLAVGTFISAHIFGDPPNLAIPESSPTHVFADVWWPEFHRVLIRELIEPTIPEERSLLDKYGNVADQFCEFEGRLRAIGMFSSSNFID